MISDAQKKAQKKYNDKNIVQFTIKMQKELHNKMMEEVEKTGTNRMAFAIQAIREKLERMTEKD